MSFLYPKRKTKALPKYLTVLEIKRLFSHCQNLKHLCVLQCFYCCDLRIYEVVALKIVDIDSTAMRILLSNAKGKKDRVVPFPKSLLKNLRNYYKSYKLKSYLFLKRQKRVQYSIKSVQEVTKKYDFEAEIKKKVTPHILRHSYATHQLENRVNIRYI